MSSSVNESRDRDNSIDNCKEANIMRKGWALNIGHWNNLFICAPDSSGWSSHYLQVSEIRPWSSKTIVFWQKWTGCCCCRLKSSSTLIFEKNIFGFCCKIIPIEFPLENISWARDVWRRRKGMMRSSGGVMIRVLRSQEPPSLLFTISLAPWQFSSPPATHHSTPRQDTPSNLKIFLY